MTDITLPAGKYTLLVEGSVSFRTRDSDVVVTGEAPSAFTENQWSVSYNEETEVITVTITGGLTETPEITSVQIRVGNDPWENLREVSSGVYEIFYPLQSVTTSIKVRKVNIIDAGADSDIKQIGFSDPLIAPSFLTAPEDSINENTITVSTGLVSGNPVPTLSIVMTLDDSPVTPTGTGPWTYVVGSSMSDQTVAWTVTATSSAGSVSLGGQRVIPGSDTVAPVVNAIEFDQTTNTVTLDLIEASLAATAVWATADPSTDPTYTIAGGWSGTTYETGSFAVTTGGDTDTVTLTATTPAGSRELTIYFYDSSDNLSSVERIAFTMPDVTAPTVSAVSGTQTGATTATWAATSDEAGGTMYAATWPAASADPSAAQVVAGTGGSIVAASTDTTPTADSANGGSFTGLTASTEYQTGVVHVDAAGNQSSLVVSSGTFTTASASSPSLTKTQDIVALTDSGSNISDFETNPITIGTGSNRVLILAMPFIGAGNTSDYSGTTVTFGASGRGFGTGTPMTIFGPYDPITRRVRGLFAVLVNPPSGVGTVQIQFATSVPAPLSIAAWNARLLEYEGASQNIGDYSAVATGVNGTQTLNTSFTVLDGALLSILSILGGDVAHVPTATNGGGGLVTATSAGSSGFSDGIFAYSTETVSAGTDGNGFSWTTGNDEAAMATLNIPAA